MTVYPIGYGEYFTVLSFIFAFITQRGHLRKICSELRDIRNRHPLGKKIFICHSFGTYLVSKTLKRNADITCDSLILCGSIISPKFPWNKIPNCPVDKIINEVACQINSI